MVAAAIRTINSYIGNVKSTIEATVVKDNTPF